MLESLSLAETVYYRDDALLYIAYMMAPLIPARRSKLGGGCLKRLDPSY